MIWDALYVIKDSYKMYPGQFFRDILGMIEYSTIICMAGHVQNFFNLFVNGWLKPFNRPTF